MVAVLAELFVQVNASTSALPSVMPSSTASPPILNAPAPLAIVMFCTRRPAVPLALLIVRAPVCPLVTSRNTPLPAPRFAPVPAAVYVSDKVPATVPSQRAISLEVPLGTVSPLQLAAMSMFVLGVPPPSQVRTVCACAAEPIVKNPTTPTTSATINLAFITNPPAQLPFAKAARCCDDDRTQPRRQAR